MYLTRGHCTKNNYILISLHVVAVAASLLHVCHIKGCGQKCMTTTGLYIYIIWHEHPKSGKAQDIFYAVECVNQNRLRWSYDYCGLRTTTLFHDILILAQSYQQLKEDRRTGARTHGQRCARPTLYLLHHSRLQACIPTLNNTNEYYACQSEGSGILDILGS